MTTLEITAYWDRNLFQPYVNINHHWFRVIITAMINVDGVRTQVPSNVLWDARSTGFNTDPNPPDGITFYKLEDSVNYPHNWYLVHNKYTLYGAVNYLGVWYTAKTEIDLDAQPPIILQFGRSPLISKSLTSGNINVKSIPNAQVKLFKHNQTSDSYVIFGSSTTFSANSRTYNKTYLIRQFDGGHIKSEICGGDGKAVFTGLADGSYVVSSVEPGRSDSFMMNEVTISGGVITAGVRQIYLEYTDTGQTRTVNGVNQRKYTMVAKYTNPTDVVPFPQTVPFVSGASPIKYSTGNNGDYISISNPTSSSEHGWFKVGLNGIYINDSIAATPPENSEPGTYWTDSFIVPPFSPSSTVYSDFTSLQDALLRKDLPLKQNRTVYCNGPFNVGNKVWQNGTVGNCDETPNAIYHTKLYNKAYTVANGIITENTVHTTVENPDQTPIPDQTAPDTTNRWGGLRTADQRGLIKDYRFTSAQLNLASNGAIINTYIDIDVDRLKQGFITDKNWGNLLGYSYKRWKIDQEDFRSENLINIPIDPLFTGYTFGLTVAYFDSLGVIEEQYQEFLQL